MSTIIMATNSNGKARRCDSKCHDARGKKCTCICQGRNHGVGVSQAIQNTNEYFRRDLKMLFDDLLIRYPWHQMKLFDSIE